MRLGFAVKVLGAGGLPSQDTRRWQSGPHLKVSLELLHAVFAYCEDTGIEMYRMTASLAPYATHPDLRSSTARSTRASPSWPHSAHRRAPRACASRATRGSTSC